jgi:hypothetical protein
MPDVHSLTSCFRSEFLHRKLCTRIGRVARVSSLAVLSSSAAFLGPPVAFALYCQSKIEIVLMLGDELADLFCSEAQSTGTPGAAANPKGTHLSRVIVYVAS